MQAAIKRIIEMFEPLRSYFCSLDEDTSNGRLERLKKVFSDSMTIVYLHFFNHALPVFDNLNILLQRQDPQIHQLQPCMHSFVKKCLLRIVDPCTIATLDIWTCNTTALSLLPDNEVNVGYLADEGVQALLESGDIDNQEKNKFVSSVKVFWSVVHKYAINKLPYKDDVILNSQWIDYFNKSEAKFSQVRFFVENFPCVSLTANEMDTLREEFDDYKTLKDEQVDIESCLVSIEYKDSFGNHVKKTDYKMDRIWGNISQLKLAGSHRFSLLSKVASITLVIPHSNADEERIFSSVRKDKTSFRASMELDRTLSSLLVCQLNNEGDCLSYEPTRDVIVKSKKVTRAYNTEHSKKN